MSNDSPKMGSDKGKPGTFPVLTHYHLLYFTVLIFLEFNWVNFVFGSCPYENFIIGAINEIRREFPLVLGIIYMITTSRFIRIPARWQLQTVPRVEMSKSILYVSTATIVLNLYRIAANAHIGLSIPEATAFFFTVYTQLSIWATARGVTLHPRIPWRVSILGNLVAAFKKVAYDQSGGGKMFAVLWLSFGAVGCIQFVDDFQKSNQVEVALIQKTDPVKYYNLNQKMPNSQWLDVSAVSLAILVARMESLPVWAHPVVELIGNTIMMLYILFILVDTNVRDEFSPAEEEEEAEGEQTPTATEPFVGVCLDSEKVHVVQQNPNDEKNKFYK